MRIDNYANIFASAKTNVADLISRLNPGDVIRAKVLEITSDEVVLKLFDGTVMRAGMLEALNAKAGDMVMLSVTSKLEGTIYLESVKNMPQMIEAKPETLKQLLETLQIKPDAQNLELAAEFIKAGAPVTAENMEKAASLLSGKPALDSEKAVFMTLKGLNADSSDTGLLSRLLEGEVKLGRQLKEIQILLEQANPAGADKGNAVQANPSLTDRTEAADVNQANITGGNQANTDQTNVVHANAAQSNISQINIPQTIAADQTHATGANKINEAQSDTIQTNAAVMEKNSAELSVQIQGDTPGAVPDSGISAAANKDRTSVPASDLPVMTQNTSEATSQQSADINAASLEKAVLGVTKEKLSLEADAGSAERFTKLIEAVRDLFIKTDSEKLSSELDVKKINNELNEKLELLKSAIQSSENLDSGTKEALSAAAAQIEDTQRLLHQMNAGNILYYQLPVNLAGYDTTAELYVMNRRKDKKKIDPNNTVMFISLDTVNMGRVETLLDIKNKNVTVNLRTESKKINEFIKAHIKDLYTGLAACGYKLAGVRYATIDAAATPIQQERLLDRIAGENYGKVDYRI